MPSLAQSVIGGAQDAQTQQGHTVGDAVQAFHIAATAEHARQELEMEKQKQDLAKATWVSSQYDKIGRTAGPAQDMMIDQFGKQMQQIQPGFNPDILKVLKKDPDALRAMVTSSGRALSRGQITDPNQAMQILAMHNGDLDGYMGTVQKLGEENAQIEASRLKAASMEGRVLNGQDQATQTAVNHVHSDPLIKTLVGQDQSLQKARGILSDPNHKPSWIELDESMQDAAKVLNGGTVSSDMKLKQLQASMFDKDTGHIAGYLSSNPDQPASPQAIAFGQHFVNRLSGQIDGQLSQAASRRAAGLGPQFYHNPNIAAATTNAIKSYQDGSWRGDPGINAPQPVAGAAAPAGQPSATGAPPIMDFNTFLKSQSAGR